MSPPRLPRATKPSTCHRYIELELPLGDGEGCAARARPLSALHERRRVLGGGVVPPFLSAFKAHGPAVEAVQPGGAEKEEEAGP